MIVTVKNDTVVSDLYREISQFSSFMLMNKVLNQLLWPAFALPFSWAFLEFVQQNTPCQQTQQTQWRHIETCANATLLKSLENSSPV